MYSTSQRLLKGVDRAQAGREGGESWCFPLVAVSTKARRDSRQELLESRPGTFWIGLESCTESASVLEKGDGTRKVDWEGKRGPYGGGGSPTRKSPSGDPIQP